MPRKGLVIDKDRELAEAIALMLHEMNFEVEILPAINAESLNICWNCDLIVVEVDSDEDLHQFIRSRKGVTVPILITSFDPFIVATAQEQNSADDYALKPFDLLDFEQKVLGVVSTYF